MNHKARINALASLPPSNLVDLQLICSIAMEFSREKMGADSAKIAEYGYLIASALDQQKIVRGEIVRYIEEVKPDYPLGV